MRAKGRVVLTLAASLAVGCGTNSPFRRDPYAPPPRASETRRWSDFGPFSSRDRRDFAEEVSTSPTDTAADFARADLGAARDPFRPPVEQVDPVEIDPVEIDPVAIDPNSPPLMPPVVEAQPASEAEKARLAELRRRLDEIEAFFRIERHPETGEHHIYCEVPYPDKTDQFRVFETYHGERLPALEAVVEAAEEWLAGERARLAAEQNGKAE